MKVSELTSKRNAGNAYLVETEDGISKIVHTTCFFGGFNGRTYCVFYDAEMDILKDPSLFMTVEMAYDAENTRLQASSAMKLLCSFCTIIGIRFTSFGIAEARAFLQFLRGTLSDGVGFVFNLRTVRSEATVAAYLKTMRRYAIYLGVSGSPFLLDARTLNKALRPSGMRSPRLLAANVISPLTAPQYVSVDQYKRVLSIIEDRWSLEERAICRLMFEHGLRIGEVLGLTIEDLDASPGNDGILVYSIVIRNRLSDKIWQKAKTLMAITAPAQYRSSDYWKNGLGCQRIYISESLFGDIAGYLEESRTSSWFTSDSCRADPVSGGNNQYVFCNSLGKPLTSNLWNKRLRAIMASAEIPLDEKFRRTNLNHRFRHGYAMFLTWQCGKDPCEVKTLLRHKSLKLSEVYHRPTDDDVRKLQGEIMSEMEGFLLGGKNG